MTTLLGACVRTCHSDFTTLITGYNTDIEHDGVIYHVQTEDKGLETPLILSLVYSGGAILASKRTRYEDLIASGFSDEALTERLTRQHKLICAAIHAGRLEDLKRMAAQTADAQLETEVAADTIPKLEITDRDQEREDAIAAQAAADAARETARLAAEAADVTAEHVVTIPPEELPAPYTVYDPRHESLMGEVAVGQEGLRVTLLDDQEFHSGQAATLRIMVIQVTAAREKPIADATVSVKVLGTAFRPKLISAKTQLDGVAVVQTQIPEFSSGRAAILIRVAVDGTETELRRVIIPG